MGSCCRFILLISEVQRAFGDFVGYVSAQSSIALNITNLSVLVVLFLEYINTAIKLLPWQRWLTSAIFVIVITLINLKGKRSVQAQLKIIRS